MSEKKPSFEEQLKQLEAIVKELEGGDVPLEESLEAFKKGMTLSQQLKETLTHAEEMLVKIVDETGQEVDFKGE